MVRRMTPSQYNSLLRQQQSKFNQAVRHYNQEVDRVNRHNKQVVDNVNRARKQLVDDYNRWARSYNQNLTTAVSRHNQAVRSYNSQSRSRRQRLLAALRASSSGSSSLRTSTYALNEQFEAVHSAGSVEGVRAEFLDLAEQETANSLAAARVISATDEDDVEYEETPGSDDAVVTCLEAISEDLKLRWQGAIFSLKSCRSRCRPTLLHERARGCHVDARRRRTGRRCYVR